MSCTIPVGRYGWFEWFSHAADVNSRAASLVQALKLCAIGITTVPPEFTIHTPRNGHMLCLFTQQLHGGANCWLSDSALSCSAHLFRRRISVRGLADGCATCDIYTALDAGKTFGEGETTSSWRSCDVTQGPLLFGKLSWHLHKLFRSRRLSTCFHQEPSPRVWYLYFDRNPQDGHWNQEPSGTEGSGRRTLLSLTICPNLHRILRNILHHGENISDLVWCSK